MHFKNNLRKYVFENFEETIKGKCPKNFAADNSEKI